MTELQLAEMTSGIVYGCGLTVVVGFMAWGLKMVFKLFRMIAG